MAIYKLDYYFLIFLTTGKPLVAQKLQKLPNLFGSEPYTLAGRHQKNHHAAKPN